jgi:hypothetical protein
MTNELECPYPENELVSAVFYRTTEVFGIKMELTLAGTADLTDRHNLTDNRTESRVRPHRLTDSR